MLPPSHHHLYLTPSVDKFCSKCPYPADTGGVPLSWSRTLTEMLSQARESNRGQGLLPRLWKASFVGDNAFCEGAHVPPSTTQHKLGKEVYVSLKLPTSVSSLSKKEKIKSTAHVHLSTSLLSECFIIITECSRTITGRPWLPVNHPAFCFGATQPSTSQALFRPCYWCLLWRRRRGSSPSK